MADTGPMTPVMIPRSVSGVTFLKGKGKSAVEPLHPPPPQASLRENGSAKGEGDAEVWPSFRDAGLLEEAAFLKKDRESLVQRILNLEKELHEYQYSMGLLLIEKKEWDSKYQELRQALAELDETLKREKSGHLASVSEYEKREENLCKALGVEQQCVSDLEKALCEMRSELAEMKFVSDKKLDDACSLEVGLEEKYLEVEQKLHSAEAKLAEATRRFIEANIKLEDAEAREQKLQNEHLSFTSERKLHDKDITDQRVHFLDWENKLQDCQKRLADSHRSLNEREDQANDADKILKKKASELEVAQKLIETTKKCLKLKEEDFAIRLSSLAAKDKETDVKFDHLNEKEKDMLAREEKLDARERVEIQKLVDDHNALLSSKKEEFELDLERERESFHEELERKICEVRTKKQVIEDVEDQITTKEQTLQIKFQQLNDIEKDLETKSKALKKWEESVHSNEKRLNKDRQKLSNDQEELLKSKSEIEGLIASMESSKENIKKEEENLKLTKNESENQLFLQSTLKLEIENYRIMKESLLRKTEDLQQQKEKFEKEWDVLDEKILRLGANRKKFNEKRNTFEKWLSNEEERMKSEALVTRANFERELEELWQKKEAFEKTMEHDRLDSLEVLKRERADMDREFELQKHVLEMDMLKRKEEMEKKLLDRESDYQRKKDMELNQMKSLSSLIDLKGSKLNLEEDRLDREKEDLASCRKQLEIDRLEIEKDINSLRILSQNLKEQREDFIKEKKHFICQLGQKTCKNCGVRICDPEIFVKQNARNVPPPDLVFEEKLNNKHAGASPKDLVSLSAIPGGRKSWLQKCSSIFNFSPGEKAVVSSEFPMDDSTLRTRLHQAAFDGETSRKPALIYGVANSIYNERAQSVSGIGENGEFKRLDEAVEEPEISLGVADNSIDIMRIQMGSSIMELRGKEAVPQSKRENSAPAESDSHTGFLREERPQPSRRGMPRAARRTKTAKTVVNDAIHLGMGSTENHIGSLNEEANDTLKIRADGHGESFPGKMMVGKKRGFAQTSGATASELDAEDSEARSENVSNGGHSKRRQVITPAAQTPGEKRYNFRCSTISTAAAAQTISDQTKGLKSCSHQHSIGNVIPKESAGEGSSRPVVEPDSGTVADSKKPSNIVQKSTAESITEILELEMGEIHVQTQSNDADEKSIDLGSQSGDGYTDDDAGAGTEPATPSSGGCSEDGDDEYEPPNASIGKKIWTFFTT